MRQVVSSHYPPTGNKVDVIDPYALQTELTNLESANIGLQAAMNDLIRKVDALQAQADATQMFYGYITTHYPRIIEEYTTREAVKAKVCPRPSLVEADMQELELRTLAAIRKLP
jgi:hypothetical protein